MKRIGVILSLFALFLGGCDTKEVLTSEKLIAIAWDDLSPEETESVTVDKDGGAISKYYREELPQDLPLHKDAEFTYGVLYHTTYDAQLGPIIVFVDPITHNVVGRAWRY
jgi:hypothetical protein